MFKLKLLAGRLIIGAIVSIPVAAAASQGPGGGLGTAGPITQLTMAIAIYGRCAAIVVAGVIGGLRSQSQSR